MKIVCISDTHGLHEQVSIPEGDILLHAGDISKRGKEHEVVNFNHWLATLPHPHKVMIAGNHDFIFEQNPTLAQSLITNAIYLNDSMIEINGLKIWGSPISPWFHDWAFNRKRGNEIKKHWDLIPAEIDILITHGPPFGILDYTASGRTVGCEELAKTIIKIKPKIHLFGHIHESYGIVEVNQTTFINASILDLNYKVVNQAVVIEI
ncbi:MAG: metallophosphatase domain-containing protein [Thermoflexibacter sp.]|jgi:Icc-related predicted phosphoesterase|nr:metallophosphatase domain-containing protein [Thermoflexibacter sp.]